MPSSFHSLGLNRAGSDSRKHIGLIFVGISLVFFGLWGCKPSYTYEARELPATFDQYYQRQLERSKAAGVRPNNEERLVRYAPRTEIAVLFIHGFGASRAEGEAVIEPISAEFRANTYYLRLPGHGTDAEKHAAVKFPDYLDLAEEAFAMTKKLGERVVIVGASTGALLATHLAARYPEQIAGVVLGSPFYEFNNPAAVLFRIPGGLGLVHALYGEDRDVSWGADPEKRKIDGYDDYWLTQQKYAALVPLDRLRRYIVGEETFQAVTCPVLLMYYYKDEEHQDAVVSVPAMRAAFDQFGRAGRPHPLNRQVAVANSNHIMMSAYVRSDKETVVREIRDFLTQISK